jgi:hypothetical protein
MGVLEKIYDDVKGCISGILVVLLIIVIVIIKFVADNWGTIWRVLVTIPVGLAEAFLFYLWAYNLVNMIRKRDEDGCPIEPSEILGPWLLMTAGLMFGGLLLSWIW